MSGEKRQEIRCGQCGRLVGVVRHDGALELVIRHGKEKHTTVVWGPG